MAAEDRERYPLRFGARAVIIDGEVGSLRGVVMAPRSGKLDGLVIRKGFLIRREVLVPPEAVADIMTDRINIALTAQEFEALPTWKDPPHIQPRHHVLEHGRIRNGQRVIALDGDVGTIEVLLMEVARRRAEYCVVRRGSFNSRMHCVRVEWVHEIDKYEVYIDLRSDEVDALPEYLTDDELVAEVFDSLWQQSGLDPGDIAYVQVAAREGTVYLGGHTRTEASRLAIENFVWQVRGVLTVHNQIESFEKLAVTGLDQAQLRRQSPPDRAA